MITLFRKFVRASRAALWRVKAALAVVTCPIKGHRPLRLTDQTRRKEFYAAERLSWKVPDAMGVPHWVFDARPGCRLESDPAYVGQLRDVAIWSQAGAIIASDGKLIEDLSIDFVNDPSHHAIFRQWRITFERTAIQRAGIITAPAAGAYYHWMFDVLPRLHLLQLAGFRGPLISPSVTQGFQRETLARFGIDISELIQIGKRALRVRELTAPSASRSPGNVPQWKCALLRDVFLTKRPGASRRIYVSRDKASHRRVLNEGEVVEFLMSQGIERVFLEEMTVAAQAELFANCNLIVAPHGGGLSNLVFCGRGTRVVEIFPPTYLNECFWGLASRLDLNYSYLTGVGATSTEYDMARFGDDMTVDIAQLRRAFAHDKSL